MTGHTQELCFAACKRAICLCPVMGYVAAKVQ